MPVLVLHGIWDSSARMAALAAGLTLRGVNGVHAIDLTPNDGRAPIRQLAEDVARAADALARREGSARVDVVGFSMGALVARAYIQRAGGRGRVRRFVSIAGPHHGTLTAFALPFARFAGALDMRPASALLRDLAGDADPFGAVEVHGIYTPYDLMIVPAKSSILPGMRSVRAFPVPLHRLLVRDARVFDHIAAILRA
jgi:triacylglycerol lipase